METFTRDNNYILSLLLQSKYLGVALSVSKAYCPRGLFRMVFCLCAVICGIEKL